MNFIQNVSSNAAAKKKRNSAVIKIPWNTLPVKFLSYAAQVYKKNLITKGLS